MTAIAQCSTKTEFDKVLVRCAVRTLQESVRSAHPTRVCAQCAPYKSLCAVLQESVRSAHPTRVCAQCYKSLCVRVKLFENAQK
jgi:hypothetical protein